MDRLRPLTAARFLGLAVLIAAGCAHTARVSKKVTHAVESAAGLAKPSPATAIACGWQPRLSQLPNPVKNGALAPGIAGELLLIAEDGGKPEVDGDVTVAVYDDTPRPDGTPAHKPEVWHFTKDVVRSMRSHDERLGPCYILFLPWLPEWRDVTTVRILTRYDPPGGPTLFTGECKLALDLAAPDAPVWTEAGKAGQPAGFDGRTVPNGAQVMQQVRGAAVPNGVKQAGGP